MLRPNKGRKKRVNKEECRTNVMRGVRSHYPGLFYHGRLNNIIFDHMALSTS